LLLTLIKQKVQSELSIPQLFTDNASKVRIKLERMENGLIVTATIELMMLSLQNNTLTNINTKKIKRWEWNIDHDKLMLDSTCSLHQSNGILLSCCCQMNISIVVGSSDRMIHRMLTHVMRYYYYQQRFMSYYFRNDLQFWLNNEQQQQPQQRQQRGVQNRSSQQNKDSEGWRTLVVTGIAWPALMKIPFGSGIFSSTIMTEVDETMNGSSWTISTAASTHETSTFHQPTSEEDGRNNNAILTTPIDVLQSSTPPPAATATASIPTITTTSSSSTTSTKAAASESVFVSNDGGNDTNMGNDGNHYDDNDDDDDDAGDQASVMSSALVSTTTITATTPTSTIAATNTNATTVPDATPMRSVTVDDTTGLLFQPTYRLRNHLIQHEMEMQDTKSVTTITMNEVEIRWNSFETIHHPWTFKLLYQILNTKFVKFTFVPATLRNNNNNNNNNTSSRAVPIPMSHIQDNNNNNNSPPSWIYQDHAVDIAWLSPTVFISTHLIIFPPAPSPYLIELISRDSTRDMSLRVYTILSDVPNAILHAFDVVCQFLQHVVAPMPLSYFSQIKLWQPVREDIPPLLQLQRFVSIIPPPPPPTTTTTTLLPRNNNMVSNDVVVAPSHRVVMTMKDIETMPSFRIGGEINRTMIHGLSHLLLNEYVRLDLWSVQVSSELMDELNHVLCQVQHIRHLTVPMGMNGYSCSNDDNGKQNKQKKKQTDDLLLFTSNPHFSSLIFSLIDGDIISIPLLHGIKCNPHLQSIRFNLYGEHINTNIGRICYYGVNGNDGIRYLIIYIDDDNESDDDDDEEVEQEERNSSKNDPMEEFSNQLAGCHLGCNLEHVQILRPYGKLSSVKNWDRYVAPPLALNWYRNMYINNNNENNASNINNSILLGSSALVTNAIATINTNPNFPPVTNYEIVDKIPSQVSVIYDILYTNIIL
jgi:hypothetical protein